MSEKYKESKGGAFPLKKLQLRWIEASFQNHSASLFSILNLTFYHLATGEGVDCVVCEGAAWWVGPRWEDENLGPF